MTGMEVLEQEFITRYHLTPNAAKSALSGITVTRVLEIFAEKMDVISEAALCSLHDREEAVQKAEMKIIDTKEELAQRGGKIRRLESEAADRLKAAEEKESEYQNNIRNVETAEARDRLRLLEIFKQNVEIETPQNNSVYIAGVASILSGTSVFPDMGKKVDK